LSHNRLSSLPVSMRLMKSMRKLKLAHNNLHTISDSLFQEMPHLYTLDLQFNNLKILPRSLSNLGGSLKNLLVNNNRLEGLPLALGCLLRLKHLTAHHNQLSVVPASIGGLANIRTLSLHTNFIDSLPHAIGLLGRLKVLELNDNRLTSLPPTISLLKDLRRADMQNNRFKDLSALQDLGNLAALKSVQFDAHLHETHPKTCMCRFCVYSRFDEAHFDDIVEGDVAFETELIELFFQCMNTDFSVMQTHIKNAHFAGIFFVVHKIKGALANMGAIKLSELCATLELHSRDHDMPSCVQIFQVLQAEYQRIKVVLEERLHKRR